MDEYISREVAVEQITFLCELREIVCNPDDEFLRGLKNALNAVKSNELIPSADVQPIVYAHKTINVGRRSYCSNCGKLAVMEDFCSKCGAKVKDGDTE